jgi:DNA repair protein RadC
MMPVRFPAVVRPDDKSPLCTYSRTSLRELTYAYRVKVDGDGRSIPMSGALTRPGAAAAVLTRLLAHEAVEVFGMLCLTTRRHVICWHEVSRGCLNGSYVHPREVFKPAFMANADAIVISHNHPSGDPEPSPHDLELTDRLRKAGDLLGLPVLDHVIVGHNSFISLMASSRLVGFTADRPITASGR